MSDSLLKTINNSIQTSFRMDKSKNITTSFLPSDLGENAFYLYVAHGEYQTYRYEWTDDDGTYYEDIRTKDQAGWPHSNPYTPGPAIQIQFFAQEEKNYSMNIKLHSAFSYAYDDNSSGEQNSFYRFRLDVDDNMIYDGEWQDGTSWPYNQNMRTDLDELTWVDFGTYEIYLTKGIHIALLRFGACHQYDKHAAILADDMMITLS